jgi:hypothetical protein
MDGCFKASADGLEQAFATAKSVLKLDVPGAAVGCAASGQRTSNAF